MDSNNAPYPQMTPPTSPQEIETRQWAMILHFSQFAGHITFGLGLLVPILIWQLKKNDLPGIDEHGKNVTNWVISELIYALVCFLLSFVLIGIPMAIVLSLVSIIFPILGGIKANNGEVWKYPLAIPFFK